MEPKLKLDVGENMEYKVKAIKNNIIYANKVAAGQLPILHYLISLREYLEAEKTGKLVAAAIHLQKIINAFHKDHLEKPMTTSLPIDSIPLMAKPTNILNQK